MSFLDDAEAFMKNRTPVTDADIRISLKTPDECESVKKRLRQLYDSATEREIDRVIDLARDHFSNQPTSKEFYEFARVKLED